MSAVAVALSLPATSQAAIIGSEIIDTVAGAVTGGDDGPATQAQLDNPSDVAVDAAGNLYIGTGGFFFFSDGDKRVRKVDVNGIITTVAGNGQFGSNGDGGPATQAELCR